MTEKIEPGMTVGMVTVQSRMEAGQRGGSLWLCRCECGNEIPIFEDTLLTRKWLSCGCKGNAKTKDITGQRFGNLVVLERTINAPDGKSQWLCQCDCGNTCIKEGRRLLGVKFPPSCGCLATEKRKQTYRTHGMSDTPLFKVWQGMKDRCMNPRNSGYKDYGGRGIKVCDRWLDSFQNFYDDMHEGYQEGLQIDRIDVNGNYEPDNCRWATVTENARNKRNNIHITTALGEGLLVEQAETVRVNKATIKSRIDAGIPEEFAILPTSSFRGKGVQKAIDALKDLNDKEPTAAWLEGDVGKKVEDIIESAVIQAKAVDTWGVGPDDIIIGEE